jgi:lipopolysaccharide transport system ATP-binding protein
MTEDIIEVKNLGKKYNITHMRGGYVALRDVITNIAKNPFRYIKSKSKQVIGLEKMEEFWALKGVSFSVKKGEIIGIIGANGAGKSTLLKILSQITPPTEGEIILRGRVGSLLEVGTGFHPELTGRENIFLNGAILGMKKREIEKKFNEIVAFAGVDRFLDTPVKFYSSGMYVRLAFSVAAHMEPDILLVDEVLAVGDAEFQKKCLGKMDEITKKDGRTILFVSHNMGAIQQLCQKSILLQKGAIKLLGPTRDVIDQYLNNENGSANTFEYPANKNKKVTVRKVILTDENGKPTSTIKAFEPFNVDIEYDLNEKIEDIHASIVCTDISNNRIFVCSESDDKHEHYDDVRDIGSYKISFHFPRGSEIALNKGNYFLRVCMGFPPTFKVEQIWGIPLVITDTETKFSTLEGGKGRDGLLLVEGKWECKI